MIREEANVALSLLRRIEIYLRAGGMRPTRFGREAVGDSLFVAQLRRGRNPRPRTQARVNDYLDRAERMLGAKPCRRRR